MYVALAASVHSPSSGLSPRESCLSASQSRSASFFNIRPSCNTLAETTHTAFQTTDGPDQNMIAPPVSMVLYHEISSIKSKKREKIPEGTLCVVCGDLASGIHYSVASCNGCKTFFRRALVNKQTFTCQFAGECVVGKSVRCVCRSCRLKKCFDMGMDPKAIQHDRDKIRYTKALKKKREEEKRMKDIALKEEVGSPGSTVSDNYINTSTPSSSTMVAVNELDNAGFDSDTQNDVKALIESLLHLEGKMTSVRNAYRFSPHTSATSCMYKRCLFDDYSWMQENSQCQEMTRLAMPCTLETLRMWFVRDLTLMMEWGKCLPIMERLLLNDKLALMKAFAPVFPLLQLAFYTNNEEEVNGIPIKQEPGLSPSEIAPDRLNYPDGTYIERDSGINNTEEMYSLLINGCYKMLRKLHVNQSTIVMYKMLLFHNLDADGLSSTGKKTIELERMRLLAQLYYYLSSEHGKDAQTLFSNLLMMTATLNRVASFIKRVFDINHIFNRTNDLIDQLIIVGL